MKQLPIGLQVFEAIRQRNAMYVDKTGMIYDLVSGRPKIPQRPAHDLYYTVSVSADCTLPEGGRYGDIDGRRGNRRRIGQPKTRRNDMAVKTAVKATKKTAKKTAKKASPKRTTSTSKWTLAKALRELDALWDARKMDAFLDKKGEIIGRLGDTRKEVRKMYDAGHSIEKIIDGVGVDTLADLAIILSLDPLFEANWYLR